MCYNKNSQQTYASDWRQFERWCHAHALRSCPAEERTVILYITAAAQRGLRPSTIKRHLAAIRAAHLVRTAVSPVPSAEITEVMRGIARAHGAPVRGAKALLPDTLRRIVEHIDTATLLGKRDRALLLLGFAGALRRSELVGIHVEDLTWCPEGVLVLLARSKTDQTGQGRWVGIPYGTRSATCPVAALREWLAASSIATGAVFRGMDGRDRIIAARLSGRAVARMIKRRMQTAGLDSTGYSGHSLRVGHCTAALRAGVPAALIMQQTGHRSYQTMLQYVQVVNIFDENSVTSRENIFRIKVLK